MTQRLFTIGLHPLQADGRTRDRRQWYHWRLYSV